jgi:hypothetical protein
LDVSTVVHSSLDGAGVDSSRNILDRKGFPNTECNQTGVTCSSMEAAEVLTLKVNVEEGLGILDDCLGLLGILKPIEESVLS